MSPTSQALAAETPRAHLDAAALRRRFDDVRQRTLALIAPLDWPELRRQHISLLSPMVWDLGHIGMFEEMWLLDRIAGEPPLHPEYGDLFNPEKNPRSTRDGLPLPDRRTLFDYLGRVRRRALQLVDRLEAGELERPGDPLLAGGLAFELVFQHEEQHQETLLQALQVMDDPPYLPGIVRRLPPGGPVPREMIHVPGGPFLMGWGNRPGFAYDNERELHEVALPGFLIAPAPVTNEEYLAFVEGGGYRARELWSEAGWRWKEEEGARAPRYWLPPDPAAETGGWRRRRLGWTEPLAPKEPVIHVTYWEAEAYARFAGKRLPTEAEWEKAALWDPAAGRQRLHPWGDEPPTPQLANVDQLAFGPAEVGAYPRGVSAYGVHQMIGDVWEWTSSDFTAYPGFTAFPYREYSEVFFGSDYKVLRGGSWATRPAVARGTFRNWDYPIRRQIMSGLRLAADEP